jgi:hypothetical protein
MTQSRPIRAFRKRGFQIHTAINLFPRLQASQRFSNSTVTDLDENQATYSYAVQRLQTLCPNLGKKKLSEVLARAGYSCGKGTATFFLCPGKSICSKDVGGGFS